VLVRPRVLSGKHVPGIGLNKNYEDSTVPQQGNVTRAMRELATEEA
jgi:2-oxoisovalerate dehydrogenase E1 component beta subunit